MLVWKYKERLLFFLVLVLFWMILSSAKNGRQDLSGWCVPLLLALFLFELNKGSTLIHYFEAENKRHPTWELAIGDLESYWMGLIMLFGSVILLSGEGSKDILLALILIIMDLIVLYILLTFRICNFSSESIKITYSILHYTPYLKTIPIQDIEEIHLYEWESSKKTLFYGTLYPVSIYLVLKSKEEIYLFSVYPDDFQYFYQDLSFLSGKKIPIQFHFFPYIKSLQRYFKPGGIGFPKKTGK